MHRFEGLDGLRGWLALAVIMSHIATFAGLDARHPMLDPLNAAGTVGVSVFIIISGFVITNLLLEQPTGMAPT